MLHYVDFLSDVLEFMRVLVHLEFFIHFDRHQLLDLLLGTALGLSLLLHICLFLRLPASLYQRFFLPQHQ
jgi:hypothetical protein